MTTSSTTATSTNKPLACIGLLALLLSSPLAAEDTSASESNVVRLDVPDVELLDQNGDGGRFLSDFIGGDVAAITFTFTDCGTICPALDGIFKRVQSKLGDRLGSEVRLLTVSVDPANDIPERLRHHAHMLDARPGWSFLTGDPGTVTQLLKSLEVFTPDITDHPPTVYVVDGSRDVWQRLNGFPSPDRIVSVIDGVHGKGAGE